MPLFDFPYLLPGLSTGNHTEIACADKDGSHASAVALFEVHKHGFWNPDVLVAAQLTLHGLTGN